jgi:peptidoglycan/LPS O-acetylase OafA/YrhL
VLPTVRDVSSEATAEVAREDPETTGPARASVHFAGFELLRAVAAAMVVVHHADSLAGAANTGRLHALASVGDAGVGVFFVLSGFLIYRPFVDAHASGRAPQHPLPFWWRRLLRIVPAYWLVLTFFWALGSFSLGADWWRFYLFLQIYAPETALGGVVQAWSLCTEMAFYLLVPGWAALVGLTARRVGRAPSASAHLAGATMLWLGGFASRWAMEAWWPSRRALSFNWLPTNLDLFAAGMALAALSIWVAQRPERAQQFGRAAAPAGAWWAAGALLYGWYAYRIGPAPSFEVGYQGWFWHRRQLVLGAFTVLLLVPAVFGPQDRGIVRRVWGWRPLAWVGTVSYGLYLWHFDWMKRSISAFDGFGGLRWRGWFATVPGDSDLWLLLGVGMGVGLLFAALSWYLLEQPLQRFKGAVRPR